MVIAVGRNPERKEEDNGDGVTVHNNFYSPEIPMGDNIEAAAPQEDPEAAAEAAENAAIHTLQDAPMQPEPHMGDAAPTAPMMAPEEAAVAAAASESLGEAESQDALTHALSGSEGSASGPIDEDLSEAGPSDAAGTA